MKTQRIALALTFINLALLVFQLSRTNSAEAQAAPDSAAQSPAPMLRGRGMEIVDDQGRLRAQIKLEPASKTITMPNGKTMSDTVIFRLITPDGKPRVKFATSDQGSGMSLVGETDATHVILQSDL